MDKETSKEILGLLKIIYACGDQDECSEKHLAHSLAAMIAGKKWNGVVDYHTPNCKVPSKEWTTVQNSWSVIQYYYDTEGKEYIKRMLTDQYVEKEFPVLSYLVDSYLEIYYEYIDD